MASMSLMICRGHIKASKGTFQIFLWLTVLWQIDILVQFCTLVFISCQIWKGRKWVRRSKILRAQSKYGLMGSSAKIENFLLEGHRSTSLHQKHKSAIWNRTSLHLHIKPSLYECMRVQGSQIFKQNWIISIRSRIIVILPIWVSSALGGGAGGWGVPRVISYSLYEFRNVQR